MEGLDLPEGASDRYRKLEALGRMLSGELYEDLPFSFEQEKDSSNRHITLRERRPSVDFNLAYEITQDTLAELFGDEQFPIVSVSRAGKQIEAGTQSLSELIEAINLPAVLTESYEEGVVGAVAVVLHRSDDGTPFYDILPAKYCEPIYRSKYSNTLVALVVTYPISPDAAEELSPGITDEDGNSGSEVFWYRYVVGPVETIDYHPMADERFAKLGDRDDRGEVIEFRELSRTEHGFKGRTPAVYTKNLGGKQRDIDGPALWWPIRNICIEIDYTLSQAGRGLRYSADPMLFVRKGDLMSVNDTPMGYDPPAGGMSTLNSGGQMVKSVTNTLVGSGPNADAKLLEMNAQGIAEEREYVRDLREYALEVIGGMKARAEHLKGAPSGRALDKSSKPLRRLVRRQRRPYGLGLLLDLLDLTLYGYRCGAFDTSDVDIAAIPEGAKLTPEWPNDDVLQGQDLLYHVEGLQMAAGGSMNAPIQLVKPEAMGAKLTADLGLHEPYDAIKGSCEPPEPPEPSIVKP
jgi:hypothetical protein